MQPKRPPADVIAKLASVEVRREELERARVEGRELRRELEARIDEMHAVTADDLKARCK